MTWFRVDDKVLQHPKFIGLSDAATALWFRSGVHCSQYLTDGFVAKKVLYTLSGAPIEAAKELVESGLWSHVPGGFQFHDWSEWNDTRARVEERRRSARERQRKLRNGGRKTSHVTPPKSHAEVTRNSRVTNGVTGTSSQVNGRAAVTRESHTPNHDSKESLTRARGAPDGPAAPAPGSPEAREAAERGLAQVREALTRRQKREPDE